VKVKEFFYLLGLKPRPRTYGSVVATYDLPQGGRIQVAEWLHPSARRGPPSQAWVAQLRRFLRPGDVAIDIGAQTGDTTVPMALAVGPSGLVLALEPNPYVFPVRADGEVEFQYGEPGFSNGGFHEGVSRWLHGSAFTVRVQGRNLQDFLRREHPDVIPRIRFIKVDAEGFDLAVLETLDGIIRERLPYLEVEMFALRKSPPGYRRALFDFLVARGYAVHRIAGPDDILGEAITPENLARWETYDVLCVPPGARPDAAP
jgi:hypothetical protein